MTDRCRSCGAEVIWRKTARGHAQILDREPTEAGTVMVLDDQRCRTMTKAEVEVMRKMNLRLWVDHHVTCPQASRWRKK